MIYISFNIPSDKYVPQVKCELGTFTLVFVDLLLHLKIYMKAYVLRLLFGYQVCITLEIQMVTYINRLKNYERKIQIGS